MSVDNKVILIVRRTRFEYLLAQYNTEEQARFVIESRGMDFDDYLLEHKNYQQAIEVITAELKHSARLQVIEREFLSNFIFGPKDIIVVLGQDGLVANTLKYLNEQPVIAINPDPERFDGVLLPFQISDTNTIINDVINDRFNTNLITMAKATLNDGQELIAVNDFFIGARYHISAQYELTLGKQSEAQSSSGIIVSTGLGSTGWLKSIITGAKGIVGENQNDLAETSFAWDADFLNFAVREPFPSQTTGTDIVFGKINKSSALEVTSSMANYGVIFSDGMIDDFIEFNSGARVNLSVAKNQGRLVV